MMESENNLEADAATPLVDALKLGRNTTLTTLNFATGNRNKNRASSPEPYHQQIVSTQPPIYLFVLR